MVICCFQWSSALVRATNNTPSFELPLPSSCPLLLFFRFWWVAVWTRNPIFPLRSFHVSITHGFLAPVAKFESSWNQTMFDWDSLIKDKALSLPEALGFRNLFQIFQNPAFQMIHLIKNQKQTKNKTLPVSYLGRLTKTPAASTREIYCNLLSGKRVIERWKCLYMHFNSYFWLQILINIRRALWNGKHECLWSQL